MLQRLSGLLRSRPFAFLCALNSVQLLYTELLGSEGIDTIFAQRKKGTLRTKDCARGEGGGQSFLEYIPGK